MSFIRTSLLFFLAILLLTGCMYPDERRVENRVPYPDQIQSVQSAVIQYRQGNGVLPVSDRGEETSIFQRYPVNFSQLIPNYLQSPPGNSFESGGVFQYVLLYPDEIPEVKVIDLTMSRTIQEFSRRVQLYRREHSFAPVAEFAGDELLRLDFEALNYDEEPTVDSPYHPNHRLPLLMQTNGEIVVDYTLDIKYFIEEYGLGEYSYGDDLRWLLVEHSPFIPVNSRPQTINEDGTAEFLKINN
ncbi:hypothetical protein J2S74_004946 [Evansella vedderi]|uniref:Uncharacterized protein n=1 Tax=Evansella vedderi TaxID=38282 RepID=A0ABU0A1X0_9BACI|nr:hypothetical protein [Evansella vedderi]MDQ0257488.1 hypothetical protein [Evansella vedderi]